MDAKVLDYLNDGQIETFESFENFDIITFDWYDVHSDRTEDSQMLIYLDREDLFFFCEDDAALTRAEGIFQELEQESLDNEQMLYRFFVRLLRGGGHGASGPVGVGNQRRGERHFHRRPARRLGPHHRLAAGLLWYFKRKKWL